MSKIYEYLKEKALDPKYQNKRFYTVNNCYEGKEETERYTFKEVFNAVNNFIKIYQDKDFNIIKDKPIFLPASSIVEDIVAMIALMELGAKPILIQKDSLYVFYNTKQNDTYIEFPYEIVPEIKINDKKVYTLSKNILDAYQATTNNHVIVNSYEAKQLLAKNIDINDLDDTDYDFALLTSGTTGKKKIVKFNEEKFIKKIQEDYELNSNELYMCPNPISSISGLIFTAYLPIIGNNKSAFVCFYYKDDKVFNNSDFNYENLNLITATSYFEEEYAKNKYYPALNPIIRKKTNRITLLGSRISTRCYKYLHEVFPNVKKGDIYQYYGRTENYGLISKVNDRDVKLIYIRQKDFDPDKFYYSQDKKTVLKAERKENMIIIYQTDMEYDEDDFIQISNIVDLNKTNANIDINGYLFGEIIVDDKHTGDCGFRLDDKIFYLCRINDLIYNIDHFTHVNWFERVFNKQLEKIYPGQQVKCYCLVENNKLNVYIPCKYEKHRDDNFSSNYEKLIPFINAINYQVVNDVILFDQKDIRQGDEIGKFKQYKLMDLKSIRKVKDINSQEDINNALYDEIEKILGRKVNVGYDDKNGIYIFPKNEFTSRDMAKIVYNFHILEYKTNDENNYLAIDDNFLFAKYQNNTVYQPKDTIKKLKEYIENGEIRGYIVENFGYVLKQVFEIGTYYNEKGQLTAVILDEYTFPFNEKIQNPRYDVSKYRAKAKNIERVLVQFSGFNYLHYDYFKNYEFSIDENDNLYCDNEPYNFSYTSADIYDVMRRYLIVKKQQLNKNNKKYFKRKK